MHTTLLNPTIWLLAATAAAGAIGVVRGQDAREVARNVLRVACLGPILAAIVAASAAGFVTRAAMGFLSPGAYAEEVVAARSFIEDRRLYATDPQGEAEGWLGGGSAVPWAAVPGISPCQANALSSRAQFYTNHGHSPALLLAGVPIVTLAGGRALYAALIALSCIGLIVIAGVFLERTSTPWRSREALLLLAALVGWQPVLAGIRQGDAVLPIAALVVLAWHLAGARTRTAGAAFAGAIAGLLAVPALGALPALLRSWGKAGLCGLAAFIAGVVLTVLIAGESVILSFGQTAMSTARTYAFAATNYAVLPRGLAAGVGLPLVAVITGAAALASWRLGGAPDQGFAAFGTLGVMIAPVVWSQHLALLLVPAVVLLQRVLSTRSALGLAGWSLLIGLFSLPDASAAWLSEVLPLRVPGTALPVLSFALVGLWGWVITGKPGK